MVVACLALFVALTGTSVAVSNALPKNSVGTAQLKNNAVVASKIKDGAVTAAKVKPGSLLGSSFRPGDLPKGETGATGSAGPKGDAGPQGARGPSDGYQAYKDLSFNVPAASTMLGSLAVPAGSYLVEARLVIKNFAAWPANAPCTLVNDRTSDSDGVAAHLQRGGLLDPQTLVIVLEAAATLPTNGHWSVNCASDSNPWVVAYNLKIHAIRVATLSKTGA
jgi:hypothetical protein